MDSEVFQIDSVFQRTQTVILFVRSNLDSFSHPVVFSIAKEIGIMSTHFISHIPDSFDIIMRNANRML